MACDLFGRADVKKLLKGRGILMIGDSNMRCLYKDLIFLMVHGGITPADNFRGGGRDRPYNGDRVKAIASKTEVGRDYYENREFKENDIWIRFVFVTRAYNEHVAQELTGIREGRLETPSVILINSFLWDLTRWGPLKEDQYKKDLLSLFKDLKQTLPEDTLVIWLSTLPVATERIKGGVFIKQVEFVKHSMRFWILEANKFTQQLCLAFGFNFLDLHHSLQYELDIRATDGLHWETIGVRYLTNLVMTHIALNLDLPLPSNFWSTSLGLEIKLSQKEEKIDDILLEKQVLEEISKYFNQESVADRKIKKGKRRINNPIQDEQQSGSHQKQMNRNHLQHGDHNRASSQNGNQMNRNQLQCGDLATSVMQNGNQKNQVNSSQMKYGDQTRASTSENYHLCQPNSSQQIVPRVSYIPFSYSPVMANLNPNFWADYPTSFPWNN